MLRTLDSVENYGGEQVIVRCDLNVPISNGVIQDAGRIQAALPTIDEVLAKNGRPVICSHLGRPEGRDENLSLGPVFDYLKNHYGSLEFGEVSQDLHKAEIVLLENLRYDPRETSKEALEREPYAREILNSAKYVVVDGFGVVHRKQASVFELARLAPSVAGRTIERELSVLHGLTDAPDRPYSLILGGSKVSDKLGVIDALLPKIDKMMIGGGMMFTFLKAMKFEIGSSLVETDQIDTAREYIDRASELGVELLLPTDVVVANEFAEDASFTTIGTDRFLENEFGQAGIGLDIGPETAASFSRAVEDSKTVFWNGPMGVFEFDSFALGTKSVAKTLSSFNGFSVVGGGDSAAAVRHFGLPENSFGHISTGGGASLEYLEGKSLPGLEVLID
jgi:phosphoglycerate kinase